MSEHTRPVTQPPRQLFIKALEHPAPAQCKTGLPWPRVTTLAIGEECYKGQ